MHATESRPGVPDEALAFALRERTFCLSVREWHHRLRGYGYAVRQTAQGQVLTLLTTGTVLGQLDSV